MYARLDDAILSLPFRERQGIAAALLFLKLALVDNVCIIVIIIWQVVFTILLLNGSLEQFKLVGQIKIAVESVAATYAKEAHKAEK